MTGPPSCCRKKLDNSQSLWRLESTYTHRSSHPISVIMRCLARAPLRRGVIFLLRVESSVRSTWTSEHFNTLLVVTRS